jgi:hypothetical protein
MSLHLGEKKPACPGENNPQAGDKAITETYFIFATKTCGLKQRYSSSGICRHEVRR